MLAAEGLGLIGGLDAGSARVAMEAALAAGGQVAIVMALGMAKLEPLPPALDNAVQEGRALLLSPYTPETTYSESLSRARLSLIAAQAELTLLVAPEVGPEEWPGVVREGMGGGHLMIWSSTAGEPGNAVARAWLAAGAMPFLDIAAVRGRVLELLGMAPEDGSASGGLPTLPGAAAPSKAVEQEGQIAPFADAESAIEALSRSGRVPRALARRLRETSQRHDP